MLLRSFFFLLFFVLASCGGDDGDTLLFPDNQARDAATVNSSDIEGLEESDDEQETRIGDLEEFDNDQETRIAVLSSEWNNHDDDVTGIAARVTRNEEDISDLQDGGATAEAYAALSSDVYDVVDAFDSLDRAVGDNIDDIATHTSDISGLIADTQDNAAAIQAGGGINVVDSLGTTLGKFVGKRDDGNTEMEDGAVHYIGLTSTNYFFYFRSLGGVSTTINKDIHWSEVDCAGDAYIEQIAWDSMYALQGYVFLHEYPSANLLYYLPAENRGSGANLDYLSVTNTVGACTNTSGNTTLLQVFPNNSSITGLSSGGVPPITIQ